MDTKILEGNYKALSDLAGKDIVEWASRSGRTMKFEAHGMMDLHLECLYKNRISLTHYFEMNGDLVPDPDMEIELDPATKTAKAQHFQNQMGYWEVYPDGVVDIRQFRSQNEFLATWLSNTRGGAFKLVEDKETEE